MSVHKSVTLSVGIDGESSDLTRCNPKLRAWMYPQSDWFELKIGTNDYSVHIKLSEWEKIKLEIESMIATSKETTFSP